MPTSPQQTKADLWLELSRVSHHLILLIFLASPFPVPLNSIFFGFTFGSLINHRASLVAQTVVLFCVFLICFFSCDLLLIALTRAAVSSRSLFLLSLSRALSEECTPCVDACLCGGCLGPSAAVCCGGLVHVSQSSRTRVPQHVCLGGDSRVMGWLCVPSAFL